MYDVLHGEYEEPEHEAAHDVGLEGALVLAGEALLERGAPEAQRPRAHVVQPHAPVAAYLDRVVYYIVLLQYRAPVHIFLETRNAFESALVCLK